MARFVAEKWLCHIEQDCRQLVSYWSDTEREVAEAKAIGYLTTLEDDGYELEPIKGGDEIEIRATKPGESTYVVCVVRKED